MKQFFDKLKKQSKTYSREFERAREKYLNNDTLRKLKDYKDQFDTKLKIEKEQINRQHFKDEPRQGQQRSDRYKTTNSGGKSDWWKSNPFKNFSQGNAGQSFKVNYQWTKDRFKDFWHGTKDNYSFLLREYYKDYSNKLKSYGKSQFGTFQQAAGTNYKKLIQKYSIKRRLRWLAGFGMLVVFLYGLGKGLPSAYYKYKLEAQKLELEQKKLKIKELHEKKSDDGETYRI